MEQIYEVVANTTIKQRIIQTPMRKPYTVDDLVELLLEIQKGGWGDLPIIIPDDGYAFDLEEWSLVSVKMKKETQEGRINDAVILNEGVSIDSLTWPAHVSVDAIALWTSKGLDLEES